MPFQVEELSLELIEALAPIMPRLKQRDKDFADQLRRAASSIGLNCAEASFSDPRNRRARLFHFGREPTRLGRRPIAADERLARRTRNLSRSRVMTLP